MCMVSLWLGPRVCWLSVGCQASGNEDRGLSKRSIPLRNPRHRMMSPLRFMYTVSRDSTLLLMLEPPLLGASLRSK